jgi:hypothetical protein
MKSAATKSTRSHAATVSRPRGFFGPSRSTTFFPPLQRKARAAVDIQTKLSVSRPTDALEQQADRTADRVMRMATPAPIAPATRAPDEKVQRFGEGTPSAAADVKAEIQHATTGGQALSHDVSSILQPRLGADLGSVRLHTDEQAASLSNQLSARAFTYRNHVFFGRDQYQPGSTEGRHLLAHEITHTIQQGATVQRKPEPGVPEGQRRPETPPPVASGPTPTVQRWGVDSALSYIADEANNIPGFRMLTLVVGYNPINLRSADRTAANLLRALIELVPGGAVITRALDAHGVINQAAAWVEPRIAALGDIGGQILAGLKQFIASLSVTDVVSPGAVWDRAKRILTDPIDRLVAFGSGVVGELLALVKQAILRPLAALAAGTRGYDLLKAILGQDPITGEPSPRTAETLIGGFMKLIGQDEVWENLKRGKAVPRAWAWFQGALAGLMAFVRSIPGRITATLRSLTFEDVVSGVGAFRKVGAAFLDLAAEFGAWAFKQVLSLLEILVSVVAPKVLPYIAKARATFQTIVKDPVGFVGNLVRAGKAGFQKFAGNILEHLKTALINWLVGPLAEAGVYIPQSFSLLEIVKLVLSVLGLTWQNIRSKLVKIIPEPVLVALEKTAGILVTLVTEGPAAAWDQIVAELTALKDQLISQVTEMVRTEAVKAAVTKLATMLNPAGAVVQAILAIWNTVSFFIEKINQIGAVVASFIDSIAEIASGQVDNAAKKVEQTMVRTLPVVIGFLAKFAGLGGIPAKLVGIVNKVRAPIDKGLDKIVAWLKAMIDKLVTKAKDTVRSVLEWWRKKVPISGGDEPHVLTFKGERDSATLVVQSSPTHPVEFMEQMADKRKIEKEHRATPITTTKDHVKEIAKHQKILKRFDKDKGAAVSGTKRDDANDAAKALDAQMTKLGTHFGATFEKWGVTDATVTKLDIARGKFAVDHKVAIADEAIATGRGHLLRDNAEGDKVNVRKGFARRHVVSAFDMRDHYMKTLNGKKVSEAKLLLEQRGSHTDARITLSAVTVPAVKEAAIKRYTNFFGFAKNIFIGGSRENSEIQENLDKGNLKLAGRKLWEHVDRIKRNWAFDQKFTPSEKDD